MAIRIGHWLVGKLDALRVSEVSETGLPRDNNICLQQLFRKGGCSKHRRLDQEDSEDLPPVC